MRNSNLHTCAPSVSYQEHYTRYSRYRVCPNYYSGGMTDSELFVEHRHGGPDFTSNHLLHSQGENRMTTAAPNWPSHPLDAKPQHQAPRTGPPTHPPAVPEQPPRGCQALSSTPLSFGIRAEEMPPSHAPGPELKDGKGQSILPLKLHCFQ